MKTVPVIRKTINETITVYGRIIAQPGATRVVSLPFESIVQRVIVIAGQQVRVGDPLIEIAASPGAKLQLQQAKDGFSSAQSNLQQVKEQYKQRLATKTQMVAAEHGFNMAQSRLQELQHQTIGKPSTLKAQSNGIVTTISVLEGQVVPAGRPLVDMAMGDRIEVRLGVEAEDIPKIHPNDEVDLAPVHLDPGAPVKGHVRLISKQVNTQTELVDVLVSLPPKAPLTLREYVRGTLVTSSKNALVVPSGAVLP